MTYFFAPACALTPSYSHTDKQTVSTDAVELMTASSPQLHTRTARTQSAPPQPSPSAPAHQLAIQISPSHPLADPSRGCTASRPTHSYHADCARSSLGRIDEADAGPHHKAPAYPDASPYI